MKIIEKEKSGDGTQKFLWELTDGFTIESIHFSVDNYVFHCISSQVGCPIGCKFCLTGKEGFIRNFKTYEILKQAEANNLPNIQESQLITTVFSGMGEPLLNYKNVIESSYEISWKFPKWRIGIFSVGIVQEIENLANESMDFQLCLSLHASNNELRNHIIPFNRKYPIEKVLKAGSIYAQKKGEKVGIGYLMLKGVNDELHHAKELSCILDKDMFYILLLIYNTIGSRFEASDKESIINFIKILSNEGFEVSVSKSRGTDINGGCGQLKYRYLLRV